MTNRFASTKLRLRRAARQLRRVLPFVLAFAWLANAAAAVAAPLGAATRESGVVGGAHSCAEHARSHVQARAAAPSERSSTRSRGGCDCCAGDSCICAAAFGVLDVAALPALPRRPPSVLPRAGSVEIRTAVAARPLRPPIA